MRQNQPQQQGMQLPSLGEILALIQQVGPEGQLKQAGGAENLLQAQQNRAFAEQQGAPSLEALALQERGQNADQSLALDQQRLKAYQDSQTSHEQGQKMSGMLSLANIMPMDAHGQAQQQALLQQLYQMFLNNQSQQPQVPQAPSVKDKLKNRPDLH